MEINITATLIDGKWITRDGAELSQATLTKFHHEINGATIVLEVKDNREISKAVICRCCGGVCMAAAFPVLPDEEKDFALRLARGALIQVVTSEEVKDRWVTHVCV